MKTVFTLPVHSRIADVVPSEIQEKLPHGWRLSQHQVDTYLALTHDDGPDVVINVAMTGDGKSLAGQLPYLIAGRHTPLFSMYPTNELIRDQRRQSKVTWQAWGQRDDEVAELDSNTLDQVMARGDFRVRGEGLLYELRNSPVILTNPDIFHYVMQMFYRRQGKTGDTPDKVLGPLINIFQQFTFDEFHIFEAPQIVSVLNAMLLIRELAGVRRKRFLFQSATPSNLLMEYLARADMRVQVVEGTYRHDPEIQDADQWRQILQPSKITFSTGAIDTWIDEHLHSVLIPFFLEHRPGAKGAIIVNSVAQAKRLVERLKEELQGYGITVGENTGLSSRTRRAASYESDLLIGTSTVDVGVDFQINFLIFESRDAGSFLQRLGRLGRHKGYSRDGQQYEFPEFAAHAILPTWTHNALFQAQGDEAPLLTDGMTTDRAHLAESVRKAFPQSTDFAGYAQAWGALQSARVLKGFAAFPVRGQYEETLQLLSKRYQDTFRVSINKQIGRLRGMQEKEQPLLDEVVAFRGGSYFDCGVLDMTEEGADQVKAYDLFSLIANGVLSSLDSDEYWESITRLGISAAPFESRNLVGFFRLHGFRPERTNYEVVIERDIAEWSADRFGVATVLTGVTVNEIDANSIPGLNEINRKLQRLSLPAVLCLGFCQPIELKRRLRLPMMFQLFPFRSRDNITGSIAFGREALLLDVALRHKGISCGGGAIFL